MPREVNFQAVRRAQEVLDRDGTQGEAARAAGVDERTIRTWLARGLLRDPEGSPMNLDLSVEDPGASEQDRSASRIDASGRTDPVEERPPRHVMAPRGDAPIDSRAAASRAAAQAARARVEEAEETLREKRAMQAIRRFDDEQAEEAARRNREEARRQERRDELAAQQAAALAARLEAERRAEAERAAKRRAQIWRREELPRLMALHLPIDLPPGERAVAVRALQDLLSAASPPEPPSEGAVLAALVDPLGPYSERQEARRIQEAAKARFKEAERILRARLPYETTPEETARAERALQDRHRDDPGGDVEGLAREIGDEIRASVDARNLARQVREATEAREREARSLLRIGLPLDTSSKEREEAEAHLDQRLRECPEETPREIVTTILAPLRATVERRAENDRLSTAKAARDRETADEKARRRAEWEREAEARFQELFHEVVEEEREALREQEVEDGTLDAASEKYASGVRSLSEHEMLPEFRIALRRLRTGANVDETAARILESHLLILLEKAEREARRGGK